MNLNGWNGLSRWTSEAGGHEKIGVGIRPYGFHAGNVSAVVAYPYLLCEQYQKQHEGADPQFTLQVWTNDIEPVFYVGPDGRRASADTANMYPGGTTFQFMPAPNGHEGSLADYWAPVIEGVVRGTIGAAFPYVKLEFRRASELVKTPEFRKLVLGCMREPMAMKRKIDNNMPGVLEVGGPPEFVWPLSAATHLPVKESVVKKHGWFFAPRIEGDDGKDKRFSRKIDDLAWAAQFRMLHAARLASEKPALWVVGMDHLPANNSMLMEDITRYCGLKRYRGDFLHVPLLFADGDKKLAKSLGNAVFMAPAELIGALRGNLNMGLNVKDAPVSKDILTLGPDLLPDYMKQNFETRLAALETEKAAYEVSGKRALFESANVEDAVGNRQVARMLGMLHL